MCETEMADNFGGVNNRQDERANNGETNSSNVFRERICFFRQMQKSDETLFDYLDKIRRLAKRCEFESQEEWILRDQLVLGLRDEILQRRVMAMDGNPTLDQITNVCERFQDSEKEHKAGESST